jgi:hypothetical protein
MLILAARTPWRLWLSICFAEDPRKVHVLVFRGAIFYDLYEWCYMMYGLWDMAARCFALLRT